MPTEEIISVDFTQEDAYTQILPRSPLMSSYHAKWDHIRLDYHQQPAYETPEHSSQQHVISISLTKEPIYVQRVLNGHVHHECIKYGDVVVIPASSYQKLSWEIEAEFLVLSLEKALFARAGCDLIDMQSIEIIPHLADSDPLIQQIGLALQSELESDGMGCRIYIESLATTLSIHLIKNYSVSSVKVTKHPEGLSRFKLQQAIEYINQNLEKDLGLAEMATVVGISMYHFSRMFKQSTGFSPHQYVMNCRIERAKKLLSKTEQAIHQIYQQVGFQSQSHFTNVFRKFIGTTPLAYRKQVKI
ncbi:AraC family transcriptional regulator [Brasilonema octagenarum]|uniref:AraC family transcriptional regulator n=1 Tax=Brasilonema octagenarum UFV-OR1 TaxID=417115 RepID=A0ABX1M2V0_9CYAN|nr:AraC family transcriptional regulator [Brasilonema octagenarum]NMF61511.1 AraC family transcriptional regulator [Brasilonema octagenarum UFV-OR1]